MRAVVLENRRTRIVVLPEAGAKLYDLVWKPSGRNWLWHHPHATPRPFPVDAPFDEFWCGGWDDCFPNCDAAELHGVHYPDLGELRALSWELESCRSDAAEAQLILRASAPLTGVHARKSFALGGNADVLEIRYRLVNSRPMDCHFLWGSHPALAVTEGCRLRVPGTKGIVGEASNAQLGTAGQVYRWPWLETPNGRMDMSYVAGFLGMHAGHYVTDLRKGCYVVEDPASREAFTLKFSRELFPQLWIWFNYGGYRGYYHVIVEPWTGMPVDLAEAFRRGATRTLHPGDCFEVDLRVELSGPG